MVVVAVEPLDMELVEAARAGSARAFETLVERHYGTVYAVAWARLGQRESAEDLAQEVFLRAYLGLQDLQDTRRFAPWLVRIAHNLANDWQRRPRLAPMVPVEAVSGSLADPRAANARKAAGESQEAQALHMAIGRLPAEQREVVLLHYMEGLSQREITERLETHAVAVHRLLKRGVAAMRQTLEPFLRETAPALRPTRRAVANTVALVGATAGLSAPARSALAAAEGGLAKSASASLGAMAASTGSSSLLKTTLMYAVAGGKIMAAGKAMGVIAVAALVAGGAFYFSGSHTAGRREEKRVSSGQVTGASQDLPRQTLERLMALHKEGLRQMDPSGQIPSGTQLYTLRGRDSLGLDVLATVTADESRNAGEDTLLTNTMVPVSRICNESGEPVKFRSVQQGDTYSWIVTLERSWPAREERLFLLSFALDHGRIPRSDGAPWGVSVDASGDLKVRMRNRFGCEGVLQFYLILPAGFRFERATEKPDLEEKVGENMVYGWRRHTTAEQSLDILAYAKPI